MKKHLLFSILSGLLLGLSWPTYGISFLIFFSFVPLLVLEKQLRNSSWKIFGYTYLTMLVWNAMTSWWLWYSSVFGMFFAILVNSLLMTIVFIMYHKISQKLPKKTAFIFLPAIWISFEKLHLIWDFSWPWFNLGNVFSETTLWVQWYEYTGSFGGSLWIWIINLFFFNAILQFTSQKIFLKKAATTLLMIAIPIAISLVIFQKTTVQTNTPISVAVLQPNIDPYTEKYNQKNEESLAKVKQLVKPYDINSIDLLVAPETYFAEGAGESLQNFESSTLYGALADWLSNYPKTQFVTGIQLYKTYTSEAIKTATSNKIREKLWVDFYNSAFIHPSLDKNAIYHKSKLVVGVENTPYRSIIEPLLGNVLLDLGGTVFTKATQKNRTSFPLIKGASIAPIICYESVYGSFVTDYVKAGATILVIMTNDAWWDNTQGHKQHLSYAKLRALETRKFIARSANTGISAFIDPLGRIVSQLEYDSQGVLTATVYPQQKKTFYVLYGDFIARIAVLVAGLILLFSFYKKKQ